MSDNEPVVESGETPSVPDTPTAPETGAVVPPPRRGRRWLVNILLGLLIFVCGAVTGGGVVARAAWNRVSTALHYPEQIPDRAAQHLTRVLRLDKNQSAEVKAILQRHAKTVAEVRREIAPKIDTEVQAIRDEVSAVLRPDQVKRWIRIFDDLRPRVFPPSGDAMILRRQGR